MKLPFLLQKPLNLIRWFLPSQWEVVQIKIYFQMTDDMSTEERRKAFLQGTFRLAEKIKSMKAKGWKVASRSFELTYVNVLFKRLI